MHRTRRRHEALAVDLVTHPLLTHVAAYHVRDLLIGRARAQQSLHVRLVDREQAVKQLLPPSKDLRDVAAAVEHGDDLDGICSRMAERSFELGDQDVGGFNVVVSEIPDLIEIIRR